MKNLKTALLNPSRDTRLWAMWMWNKKITESDLILQLNSFIEKGFGGVAIRPCRDMTPSYLSEEFFALFTKVLTIAKEKNIGIRIADDFSILWNNFFQSHAERNNCFRAQKLALVHSKIINSKDTFEYQVADTTSCIFLSAKIHDGKIDINTVKNLPNTVTNGLFSWKAPGSGDWRVMIFKKEWCYDPLGHYLPNVFNPKVAHAYLQHVLEKFRSLYSKFMPATLEGFINELPAIIPGDNAVPWDDDLIIKYKSRYKKNLLDIIPTLFFEVDDSFAKYRSHIYTFISQSIYERFPTFLETWAKKHRLSQWVLCPERDINLTENMLRSVMTIPAAPLAAVGLQCQEGIEKEYAMARALVDMNVNEFKRETIAVIGRNRQNSSGSLQSIKEEIDLHAFLGTSKLILDGCFFNLDQRSYIKSPFNLSWYHPDWDQMKHLCDYSARMLTIAGNMHRTCPVAVVMPSLSIMADYLPNNDEAVKKGMQLFRKVIDTLQSHNLEFDVVNEQYLIESPIKTNGEFGAASRTRKGNYQVVIFPYARLIANSTFAFLEKLAIKKGSILFINEAPQGNFDDGQNTSFTTRVSRLTRPKNETVHVVSINDFVNKLLHIEQSVNVMVSGKPCSDIQTTSGCGQNYDMYFIHNNSSKKDYFATIEYPETNHLYFIDCDKGDFHEIEGIQKNEGICKTDLDLFPKQTYVLIGSSVKLSSTAPKKDKKHPINIFGTVNRSYRVVLKDRWVFSSDTFNALPMASWTTRIGLSRDSGGFSHYYEAYFETDEVPQSCFLVFCGQAHVDATTPNNFPPLEVSVNGVVAKPYEPQPAHELLSNTEITGTDFCGASSLKFDIRETVMKGINRISIRTIGAINDPGTLFYPPVVAGRFSIRKGARGWTIDSQKTEATYGTWTKHGFPYLSGSGTYEQIFEVPTEYERIILKVQQVSGSMTLDVNGHALGTIPWQPMAVDITNLVEPRRNIIKISIRNTIDNLLRMNGRGSGLLGEVYLDIY